MEDRQTFYKLTFTPFEHLFLFFPLIFCASSLSQILKLPKSKVIADTRQIMSFKY